MNPTTVPTRIMVISDTHGHSFDGRSMRQDVDVLIHTGDLTNLGELSSLKECVRMMGTIKAELRLVIAGNHDVSLDPINRIENMSDEDYAQHHQEALEIMTGALAKESGVTYLEEGTHTFKLNNGAKFNVYVSPYTPGSGSWAFKYSRSEDRFRDMPSSNIDIVMTHGPPYSILDQADGKNLGCKHLLRAVGTTRPLLHCFGHIHEGHAANMVTWKPDGSVKNPSLATPLETPLSNNYPGINDDEDWWPKRGEQTLMVNAAIMANCATGMRPDYKPFVVLVNLPRE